MSNLHNMSWMQFDCSEEMLLKIAVLDAVDVHAMSLLFQSIILVKRNGGSIDLLSLQRRFINRHMSRKTVLRILAVSGFFDVDEALGSISFTKYAVSCFADSRTKKRQQQVPLGDELPGGNSPLVNTLPGGNSPVVIAPNAPTRREERIEKGEEETDCVCAYEEWPAEPEEMKRYKEELWYPHVQRLFQKDNTQLWRETLMQQLYDKELVGLIDRHWDVTLLLFAEHLVAWPSPRGCLSETDVRLRFRRFMVEEKLPMRNLKHHLQRLELRQHASDPRELRFYDFMDQHCPHLVQMEQALTYPQFDALRQQYGKDRVLSVLCDMENDPSLRKRDCNATAQRWLKARASTI